MTKNWIEWHAEYAQPGSSLARRLAVVRSAVAAAIDAAPLSNRAQGTAGQLRIISMCAGDGRDVLPIAARSQRGREARILLVELDEELCAQARATARELSLSHVDVRCVDAGTTDAYLDAAPAELVLCCGVFGNVSIGDVRRTVAQLRSLVVAGGCVIWTRGRGAGPTDPSLAVRHLFAANGFEEIRFVAPDDAGFRVGVHRLPAAAPTAAPPSAGVRLFEFVDQQLTDAG
jgi:hypothetical protein